VADPAIVGAVSAGAGAIIGFLGTITTGVLTRKREDRARIYNDKRAAYVEALEALNAGMKVVWSEATPNPPPRAALELAEESIAAFSGIGNSRNVMMLIAPTHVHKQHRFAVLAVMPGSQITQHRKQIIWLSSTH
jgi:hypothetical protein